MFTQLKYRLKSRLAKLRWSLLSKNPNIHAFGGVVVDWATEIFLVDGASIELGEGVCLRSEKKGYHAAMPFACTLLADVVGAKIEIGHNSRINGAYLHAQKCIKIGKNCLIASGVNILDSNGHELNSTNRTIGRDEPKSIELGDNVWIGINAVLLKGTKIGENSVVGANSVVKGEFPDNSLIAGNPAKIVRALTIDFES